MAQSQADIIYVKANASGGNNGTSWASAFTDLQAGIAAASSGDEIWVAAGTYKPTTTSTRTIYFRPPSGVAIYGGFAGTETELSQRDWNTNVTTLSGDIGSTGTANDNSYHVLYAGNVSSGTRIDGFRITEGYASSIDYSFYGGGILVSNSSMTIENCTFTDNYSANGGGAIAHSSGGASSTGVLNILNCTLISNRGGFGSALYLRGTQSSVIDCNISNNEGKAAVYIDNGNCIMDRCVISENLTAATSMGTLEVGQYGGSASIYNSLFTGNLSESYSAIHIYYNSPDENKIWNCTVAGNKTTSSNSVSSGAISVPPDASVKNCIVWDNIGLSTIITTSDVQYCIIEGGYSGTGNLSTNPLFVNPGNPSQTPFNASSYDYTLQQGSPAINVGSNMFTSQFYDTDLLDSARISGITVDMGCYEKQFCSASASIVASGPTDFCTGEFVTLTASAGVSYSWSTGATSQNIAVSTAGTYTVNVIDGSGCFGSASQVINVYPASVSIGGDLTICPGESTTLTATSPDGNIFSWNTGANTANIMVDQAGAYTVSVVTNNACTAMATATVTTQTVNTPVIAQNGNVLTCTFPPQANSYQWYFNGNVISGATSQSYTATQNGVYSVVTTQNGCTSDQSNTINVTNIGFGELELENFNMYPNPTNGIITVEFGYDKGEYVLYDLWGKQVMAGYIPNATFNLDLSALGAGSYFLLLQHENGSISRKLELMD